MLNTIKNKCYVYMNLLKYIKKGRKKKALLIDTPIHGNLGDQAIVLAEMQLLEGYNIDTYELTAGNINFQEKKYATLTPINQIILVPGGGFLGALWPNEEERFRRILKAFHKQKIIVFPQTITFDLETKEGMDYLKKSQEIYSSHPDLTIFVREKKSYKFMQQYFPSVQCKLVPDIVTILQPKIHKNNRNGILLCMRSDREKNITSTDMKKLELMLDDIFPNVPIKYTDTVVDYNIFPQERNEEVNRKLNQFAKSQLVVTDRLHGMIFAMITGTPCIALGNSNGKVKAVYEWIKGNDYIYYVDEVGEISSILANLNLNKEYLYNNEKMQEAFQALSEKLVQIKDVREQQYGVEN